MSWLDRCVRSGQFPHNRDRSCFAGGIGRLQETEEGVLDQAAWAPEDWQKQAGRESDRWELGFEALPKLDAAAGRTSLITAHGAGG